MCFFFHRLVNHEIIKANVSSAGQCGESLFLRIIDRAYEQVWSNSSRQWVWLTSAALTVNQWAGTHIQTGYFCRCNLVSCRFRGTFSQQYLSGDCFTDIVETSSNFSWSNKWRFIFKIDAEWMVKYNYLHISSSTLVECEEGKVSRAEEKQNGRNKRIPSGWGKALTGNPERIHRVWGLSWLGY